MTWVDPARVSELKQRFTQRHPSARIDTDTIEVFRVSLPYSDVDQSPQVLLACFSIGADLIYRVYTLDPMLVHTSTWGSGVNATIENLEAHRLEAARAAFDEQDQSGRSVLGQYRMLASTSPIWVCPELWSVPNHRSIIRELRNDMVDARPSRETYLQYEIFSKFPFHCTRPHTSNEDVPATDLSSPPPVVHNVEEENREAETEDMEVEEKEEKEEKNDVYIPECIICMDRMANTMVLPCMHSVICSQCSEVFRKSRLASAKVCLQCQRPIEDILTEERVAESRVKVTDLVMKNLPRIDIS